MATYTISEISEIAGVNRRNIHFYVQQGLLPPPEGAGLGARYSDEHLLRLRAIPVLRNHGLRLDEIRARLAALDAAAVAALLAPPEAPANSAPPARTAQGEPVIRYTLAPGLELLVGPAARQIPPDQLGELAQIIKAILQQHMSINGGRP